MMPTSSPDITLPTTLPREASGARCEANGTRICVATADTPTTNDETKKVAAEPDSAIPIRPITTAPHAQVTSRRFSITSLRGTRHKRPAAKPSCVRATMSPASPACSRRADAMSPTSGWE